MTYKKQYNMLGVTGAFLGGLAGGVTMLLLAPQSGENTRAQIQERSIELLDNALSRVENAVAQMRSGLINGYEKVYYSAEQSQAKMVPQSNIAADTVQTENEATQSISLASPNEEKPMDDIDNLVEQQPIADGVVNDSMGG